MIHERSQIRNAVIAALTSHTVAGARVGTSRLVPQNGAKLPAISVYVVDEVSDGVNANALEREATVAIDAWVDTVKPEELDDALDAIALEIETAIDTDPNVGLDFVFRGLRLDMTELGLRLETARPQGCAHLEYSVVYRTDPRVDGPVDDFLRVDSKTVDPAPASEDQFNVR